MLKIYKHFSRMENDVYCSPATIRKYAHIYKLPIPKKGSTPDSPWKYKKIKELLLLEKSVEDIHEIVGGSIIYIKQIKKEFAGKERGVKGQLIKYYIQCNMDREKVLELTEADESYYHQIKKKLKNDNR
jgi:hypothetical protein